MEEHVKEIKEKAEEELESIHSIEALKECRIKYLGKKGVITSILRKMGSVKKEERPIIGRLANEVKVYLEEKLEEREIFLTKKERERSLDREKIDITLPGAKATLGGSHPITQVIEEVKETFIGLGFEVAQGPEIETDYYNFVALNIPQDHPARDMQDTFYFTGDLLLRTQTSPVQIRVMEKESPPIRIIAPGKVYRCDADITHSPMFHQIEGLYVDEGVSFSHLKAVLNLMAREIFGEGRSIRFRPSYFPFTEPSAEVDVSCIVCNGQGCRVCSFSGWMEILGAGMVHPKVLTMSGVDSEKYTGFAFGMGMERIAMLKYGIDNIRLLFENDSRFLHQFK